MDPLSVAIVGVVSFCVLAAIVYFIISVTTREKTYEEVIAEQRKRQEEEREKLKNDRKAEKELMKKKYKKGKGDKSKEKSNQISEPQENDESTKMQQTEPKMVNLEIEPEIIEPTESMALGTDKPRKRNNASKKSILHNKDEVTPVADKAPDLPHKPIKPLDDVELKKLHDTQTRQEASPKKEKGKQLHTERRQELKEVPVQKVEAVQVEVSRGQQVKAGLEKKGAKPKPATGKLIIVSPPCL